MKIDSINRTYSYTALSREQLNGDSKSGGMSSQKSEEKSDLQKGKDPNHLTQAEKQQVVKLQQRDAHVRAHEAAHLAAGGSVVSGGASFTYQKGPDGKMYAIGGEVPIHITKGSNPKETLSIARQLRAAALAPSDPSPQDIKVAASAAMMEAKALQEISQEKLKELKNGYEANSNSNEEKSDKNGKMLDIEG